MVLLQSVNADRPRAVADPQLPIQLHFANPSVLMVCVNVVQTTPATFINQQQVMFVILSLILVSVEQMTFVLEILTHALLGHVYVDLIPPVQEVAIHVLRARVSVGRITLVLEQVIHVLVMYVSVVRMILVQAQAILVILEFVCAAHLKPVMCQVKHAKVGGVLEVKYMFNETDQPMVI